MPVNPLPPNPSLNHLKHQAQDLIKFHAAHDPAAAQRIREFHPRHNKNSDTQIFSTPLKLSDAQLTIARERGFATWPRLKTHLLKPSNITLLHHHRIEDPIFRHAVTLIDTGEAEALRLHLKQHPGLTRQQVEFEGGNYFRAPTLLEFTAENPIRHGTLPDNIVEIATILIEAGADRSSLNATLNLVSTGCITREHHKQAPLINLLCDRGADPNTALQAAAAHGEHQAVNALLSRGAQLDLPTTAALGRTEDFLHLFPSSTPHDRHLALALASQFGHIEIVRTLLNAEEDPSRYNPPGSHAHSTPLHQAALAGHETVVHLLVERGADLNKKDLLWHGTPADWAHHEGHSELATWLRPQQQKNTSQRP
jgi:Ankyrin repeats (3 copies)